MGKQSRLKSVRKLFKQRAAQNGIPAQKMASDFIVQHDTPKKGNDWFSRKPNAQHDEAIKCIKQISKQKQ